MSSLLGLCRDAVRRREPFPLPVLDSHGHLGPYGRFYISRPSAADVVSTMDGCGIDLCAVSSHLAIDADAVRGNEETMTAVQAHPGRLVGWIVANPHQDPERELHRWGTQPGVVGLKLHPDLHRYRIDGPAYQPVWEWAAAVQRPVLVHTWSHSPFDDPSMLVPLAERYPGTTVLLGHCGASPDGYRASIEAALRCPNIVLETSGSSMTGPWIRRLVDAVGHDRVLFGSDMPFLDPRYPLGRFLGAELDDEATTAYLSGNFARIAGLPERVDCREAR